MLKALEFRIKADFGLFRKPDTPTGEAQRPSLTYNFIPKSAAWGICGAILGYRGFGSSPGLPEFMSKLRHFRLAVTPRTRNNRPFLKTFVKFINSHGYGSEEGTWILNEQLLIRPEFILTVITPESDPALAQLAEAIKTKKAVFRPYLGKNEFIADIDFISLSEATEWDQKLVPCSSIYPINPSFKPEIRQRGAQMPRTIIMDEYPYTYDDKGTPSSHKFCFQDGEIYREQADLSVGKFYLANKKVIFGF